MADGSWLMGRKTLLTLLVLLIVGTGAHAEPGFIVLPGVDSVQVKLTASSGYQPGADLSYEIRHWPDGATLAHGTIATTDIKPDASGLTAFEVNGLHPGLWSPQDPNLYEIELKGIGKVRFGFRTFVTKDRKFYLNGRPLFLRAMPINPPGRDLPDATGKDPKFIRDYIRLLKSAHVNLIRTDTQEWLDACDELGMLTFQGNYGPIPGTTKEGVLPPFDEFQPRYRAMFTDLANHPSVVIYVLTNEIQYKKSPESLDLLTRAREDVRLLDPTRPVIGNAGFGRGLPGEIFDLHPYYGYYSGSLCDWYKLSQYEVMADKQQQPFTLSECVGAYTDDAGTFLTMSKQLSTMLRWAGPESDQRKAALDYQAELVRQVVEISRRSRTEKHHTASVMPFTYFLGWSSAKSADDLIPKPAFATLKTVFQPVLISGECWHRNLYAGDHLKVRLCVANDDDSGRDLTPSIAQIQVVARDGKIIASAQTAFPAIRYYTNAWSYVSIPIPKQTPKGDFDVRLTLKEDGGIISMNEFPISVASRDWVKTTGLHVALFDPSGKTAKALKTLGVDSQTVTDLKRLPQSGVLVIGEDVLTAGNYPNKSDVLAFLGRGGRILCLHQDISTWKSDWLPAKFVPEYKSSGKRITYIHPIGGNTAIFDGLTSADLHIWDEIGRTTEGIPEINPVLDPLMPADTSALRNSRIWAVCDQIMRGTAIAELFSGRGSVILSQFQCVDRANGDPFAARLLANLLMYAASPDHPSLVDLSKPVHWDLEAARKGVLASPAQGFLWHSAVYQHEGSSKGLLGVDHTIDGVTLVGKYSHNDRGWIDPVPDPEAEGWGIVYGKLSRPATRFVLRVRNSSEKPASIRLKLDSKAVGAPGAVSPGEEKTLEWQITREPGLVKLELRGDQRLVILDSRFD